MCVPCYKDKCIAYMILYSVSLISCHIPVLKICASEDTCIKIKLHTHKNNNSRMLNIQFNPEFYNVISNSIVLGDIDCNLLAERFVNVNTLFSLQLLISRNTIIFVSILLSLACTYSCQFKTI